MMHLRPQAAYVVVRIDIIPLILICNKQSKEANTKRQAAIPDIEGKAHNLLKRIISIG
jgi:hypothetical protein